MINTRTKARFDVASDPELHVAPAQTGSGLTLSCPAPRRASRRSMPLSPEESVNRVMKLMTLHRVRHMPVPHSAPQESLHNSKDKQ